MTRPKQNTGGSMDYVGSLIRDLWRHRAGHEVPGAILDVIDIMFQNEPEKPRLKEAKQIDAGWRLTWALPPGIIKKDIENNLPYLAERTGTIIDLSVNKSILIMECFTAELPKKAVYNFDAEEHKDKQIALPIGISNKGPLVIDITKLPHLIIGGNTGGGKSNLLHCCANALLQQGIDLYIIDLKMLEFAYLDKKAAIITDIKPARDLLIGLNDEMDRRLHTLRQAGCRDISEYNKLGNKLPYIALMIDELTELTDDLAQERLNRLARLGRAPGFLLTVATQRPSAQGVYRNFSETKALFSGTIAFHCRDDVNSRIILDNSMAAQLPKDKPGRAVWQWDSNTIVQTYLMPGSLALAMAKKLPDRRGGLFEYIRNRMPARQGDPSEYQNMQGPVNGSSEGAALPAAKRAKASAKAAKGNTRKRQPNKKG